MNDRASQLHIILGFNGTGKTTFLKEIVMDRLKNDERVLIVTPDYAEWLTIPEIHPKFQHRIEWYVKARRVIYFDGLIDLIDKNFRNGTVIFDDCRAYFMAYTKPDLQNLMIRRRQKGIDIFFAAHGFTQVPPMAFTFADYITLFKTKDNIYNRKNNLQDFDRMVMMQEKVNREALNNPHYKEIIPQ